MKDKILLAFFTLVIIFNITPLFSGEFHYYIHDHLGNTRVVIDETGNVEETYDYYPFGMVLRRTLSQPIGTIDTFTGKELDEEGDLDWYYFGARYYDPRIARWMSVDPMAEKYPGSSPYVFCANSPVNLVDPNGMEAVGDSASAAAGTAEINKALEDKNIDDARAEATPFQQQKPLFQRIVAWATGESTTITMWKIEMKGEGWENMDANDPALSQADNKLASTALNMLKDIISSKKTFTLHMREEGPLGSISKAYGGGYNDRKGGIYFSSRGNQNPDSNNYGEPVRGILLHELVGHTHPNKACCN